MRTRPKESFTKPALFPQKGLRSLNRHFQTRSGFIKRFLTSTSGTLPETDNEAGIRYNSTNEHHTLGGGGAKKEPDRSSDPKLIEIIGKTDRTRWSKVGDEN